METRKRGNPKTRAWPRRTDGFALVVALALMALVVLLIVSLGTIGQVETSLALTQQQTALARQQALYALRLALIQLQDQAGPDRRVTARAELPFPASAHPAWTGVWNFTTGPEPEPRWLVTEAPGSVLRANPGDPGASLIQLLGERSGGGAESAWVRVPLLATTEPSRVVGGPPVVNGRYAWWTGDLGVKASLRSVDVVDEIATGEAAQWLRQRSQPGAALARAFPASFRADGGEAEGIDWLRLWSPFEARSRLAEEDRALYPEFYHDVTPLSLGLLTNPAEGGLKVNLQDPAQFLSAPRFSDDVFANGKAHAAWAAHPQPNADGGIPMTPLAPSAFAALAEGDPYVHVAPVLSEAGVFLSIFDRSGQPAIRYFIDAEFWNPFTHPLALGVDGDLRALSVDVKGLPELEVENARTGQMVGPFPIDTMPRADGRRIMASWMEFDSNPGGSYQGEAVLRPGEVYQLQDPDPFEQPRGLIKYTNASLPTEPDQTVIARGLRPAGGDGVRFAVHPGLEIEGDPVFTVSGIPYNSFQFAFPTPLNGSFPPYLINSSSVDVADMFVAAFHYRLGLTKDWRTADAWALGYDLRRPSIDYAGTWTDAAGQARSNGEFINLASLDPVLVKDSLSDLFPGTELLFDRVSRDSTTGAYGDIRLYDVPLGVPTSMADFRLLAYKDLPPRALGSAFAGAASLNRAFDRYFLSTVPVGWAPMAGGDGREPLLSNSRLLYRASGDSAAPPPGEALRGPAAGEHFLVRGAFNWNSTRPRAWAMLLTQAFGATRPWAYTALDGREAELEAEAMFFRHPHGAQHRQDPLADAAFETFGLGREETREGFFRQGMRWMEAGEIEPLANAIVAELQARGKPFGSLADFLNDGLLDRALAASGVNRAFLPHANGYLTQSDLAAHLALFAAVRSDSFVIRAYGEVLNPVTGAREGEAMVEAIVRRGIDFADGRLPSSLPPTVDSGPLESRRFEVLALRWLNPSLER